MHEILKQLRNFSEKLIPKKIVSKFIRMKILQEFVSKKNV